MGFSLKGAAAGSGLGSIFGGSVGSVYGLYKGGKKGYGSVKDFFKDTVYGKDRPESFAPTTELALPSGLQSVVDRGRQLQFGALGEELDAADKISPEQLARAEISGQKAGIEREVLAQRTGLEGLQRGITGSIADQQRKIGDIVAQRGLGESSIGQTQMAAVEKAAAPRIGQIGQQLSSLSKQRDLALKQAETGRFGLEEQARRRQIANMLDVAGGALGSPGARPELAIGTPGGREGGLFSMISSIGQLAGGIAGQRKKG